MRAIKHHVFEICWVVDIWLRTLLILTQMEFSGQTKAPRILIPPMDRVRDGVGSKTSLDPIP